MSTPLDEHIKRVRDVSLARDEDAVYRLRRMITPARMAWLDREYESYAEDSNGFNGKERYNGYVCTGTCQTLIVTYDRDAGVTPFIIRCPFCGADATSLMYRITVADHNTAMYEWYRPKTEDEVAEFLEAHDHIGMLEHVLVGGLARRTPRNAPE